MVTGETGGAIVSIAPIDGLAQWIGTPDADDAQHERLDAATYAVSKAAVLQVIGLLATSWTGFGIREHCVHPGTVDNASSCAHDKGALDPLTDRVPLRCLGTDTDVADAVALLASDRPMQIHHGRQSSRYGGWTC
jgi:NAD(P)-dependent dehydrogenase (short-subunit alcohol dehydrogenase family)